MPCSRPTSTRSACTSGPTRRRCGQAIEEIFGVRVTGVRTAWVKSKPKRRGLQPGQAPPVEEGHRDPPSRGHDRAVRGPGDRLMPLKKHKPTTPGRRFATWADNAEVTRKEPGEGAHRGHLEVRRAQLEGADHLAPPRRRGQAPLPAHRLQAPQGRRAGQGRLDRVRPQPERPHRAAPLRRRREALHPGARAPARRGHGDVGREGRHPARATRCRCARSPPAPPSTASS